MVVHGAGGRGPCQCPAWEVRGLRVVGEGVRMVMLGQKRGGTNPPKPTPGMERSHFLRRAGK